MAPCRLRSAGPSISMTASSTVTPRPRSRPANRPRPISARPRPSPTLRSRVRSKMPCMATSPTRPRRVMTFNGTSGRREYLEQPEFHGPRSMFHGNGGNDTFTGHNEIDTATYAATLAITRHHLRRRRPSMGRQRRRRRHRSPQRRGKDHRRWREYLHPGRQRLWHAAGRDQRIQQRQHHPGCRRYAGRHRQCHRQQGGDHRRLLP